MEYIDVMDRIKHILGSWGGIENGLEELVRRYDIIDKQEENVRNGKYIVPDGYVLVDKYDLDELMEMAWGQCKSCVVHDCSRTKKECFENNMLCDLWKAYCKAFGKREDI